MSAEPAAGIVGQYLQKIPPGGWTALYSLFGVQSAVYFWILNFLIRGGTAETVMLLDLLFRAVKLLLSQPNLVQRYTNPITVASVIVTSFFYAMEQLIFLRILTTLPFDCIVMYSSIRFICATVPISAVRQLYYQTTLFFYVTLGICGVGVFMHLSTASRWYDSQYLVWMAVAAYSIHSIAPKFLSKSALVHSDEVLLGGVWQFLLFSFVFSDTPVELSYFSRCYVGGVFSFLFLLLAYTIQHLVGDSRTGLSRSRLSILEAAVNVLWVPIAGPVVTPVPLRASIALLISSTGKYLYNRELMRIENMILGIEDEE